MTSRRALGDVCDVVMGQAPPGNSYNSEGDGLPLIAGAGDFGESTPKPKKFTNKPTRVSNVGDIILCIRATIGDTNWSDQAYCLGRGVAGLTPHPDKLDRDYFWHVLASMKNELAAKGTGSTFKQVSRAIVEEWKVPLPPLEEQKRIAAILDKADAVRRKRLEAIELTDQLLRSVFLDMFGDPRTNPNEWEECKLDHLIEYVTYGLTVRPDYVEAGIPLISAKEIRSGSVDHDGAPKISASDFEKLSDKAKPQEGDILFSKTGSIGHSALITTNQKLALTQNAARIVPNLSRCSPLFLLALVRTEYFIDLANREAKGNAVKDLQLGVMSRFPVYMPPLNLQREFESKVSRIKSLQTNLTESNAAVSDLSDSLTNELFQTEHRLTNRLSSGCLQ